MGTLGSASIKLNLDRSQFDSDLKKLQSTDAGQIAYRIKLDTKDFERQIKGLRIQSPIFIPLEIDTSRFDQQIKKLSTSIDPIKIDLAPNVKDFQEKLRRLSNISPVTVDIKVDEAKVKQQFETIGKYAAEGFTQGFYGVEGAGKSAIDSMVKSVNKQLGIQSPSKVFREIGKYAIAGLMQGLDSVDESKLKGVTSKIEGYFKKSKIKINVDIDASGISGKVRVQAPISPTEKPVDFAKNITKSIEDGFQKAKPKANFLGAIFGSIGSLITVPLAATLRGAFEGIGTPLGLQLGTGVSKAIQSTLGQSIGSLELISQRAVEKSLQAIPAAQSAIVEVIKANPIGSAIAKQLELLQRTLELYSINLSPQKAVKSLATDQERAIASSSAAFTSQESQFKATKKAKASAANEFVDIANNQEGVKKIVPLIKQKEEDLAKKQQKLQAAQQAIAALEIRLQKIAELPLEQRGAAETSIKSKMAEFSEVLAGGNVSIEQDIKSIASLKKTGSDYFEKLNNQIKLLADLGIEQELSSQSAELLKSMEIFEQMAAAQKSVQIAQGSVKTNAKTSTAIRDKKLTKLTGLADRAKTNLDSALTSPDADPIQIQKLQKRSAAANKALDLYKLEIADPAKEIEKLNRKLTAANEVLAENIQELQSRLNKAIPALFRDASQEVVKVGNLNEISLAPSAKNQALELRQKQKQQRIAAVDKLPKLYVDAVQSVSRIVTGKDLEKDKIPNIVPSDKVQGKGHYEAQSNTYRIRPDLYKQIETGDIDQLTNEAIGNIVHEIFHAFQHGFGKAIADQTGKLAVDITPNPEELLKLGDKIEASVGVQRDARKPLSRQLETGANVFQLRNTDRVREELKRNQLKNQALSLGGVAGSKISLTDTNDLINNYINKFVEEAKVLGLDVSKAWAKYAEIVAEIRAKAENVGTKAVNIDTLPTIELEGIVKEYQEILQTVDSTKAEILSFTQKFQAISQRQNASATVPKIEENDKKNPPQTQSFKEELVIQNSKPQLARVAKELGIKGTSSKDKQGLADAIIGTGASSELIRSKLPIPTVATEKILASAQQLLQLPSQELEKSTKSAVNSFGLKLKAIAKNPDDKNKVVELQKVLGEIDELEKIYIAAKVKTLDESLQNVFQGRILGLQKQRVAATYQLKPLVGKNLGTQANINRANQPVVDAEISTERKNLDQLSPILPTPPPPPNFGLPIKTKSAMRTNYDIWDLPTSKLPPPPPGFYSPIGRAKSAVPPSPPGFDLPIGTKSARTKKDQELDQIAEDILRRKSQSKAKSPSLALPTPPPPPDFNLPIKVKQLVDKVKDSGELFKIVTDIQKDQTKGILQKLKEYDQILKIYDDLEAEKAKQNQALDDKFDPEKIDASRETITQRAKLSAKLERKYGMEGLAPEILPDRINDLGEVQKSPSILQGIKDIFKSLDNSLAKRVKKRAAQLAIEVDAAIAPSLEAGAIDAGARGDKVEQKQYQKLARQSRAATKGIAKILESPGDLTEKQVKQLDRLTSQLEKVYDAIGRPLPSQGFLESIGIGASGALGLVKNLGGVLKGFLAFSIGMWAQNFFGSIAQESFKAFVELDRLKTALNFASGGDAGGAQNLAFVRKTVDDLRVPLKASAEGFTQLAAASRNSALEGKGTREIFLGISQASTVLSLSAEDTQGTILALSQMISKGKVSSEELRQQLGERLPGAMGIAARAMGLTEVEFTRLLDTGQILSQDFLPKFAKQLQAEFGDAAKDASGNAQSAIFGVQNAFLSLQQGIGEGVSPAATAGLNVFAVILKGLSSVAKELGFILLGVTVTLGVKMVGALQAVIAQLIATKFATGTLGGGMQALGQTINNSFSVKLTAGIFAVLEVVNLLNQAINTELVQSFQKAADAARRAAEESKKAFDKPKPGQDNQGTEPVATSGVGRFLDSGISFLNMDLGPIPGGILGKKIKTYGQYERDNTANSIEQQGLFNTESLGEARYRLAQFKTGTGEGGKLRGIDAELEAAEEQRAILQAQIKRDFVDKGQAVPADSKRQLDSQNLKITALNDQRSDAAKPLTLELNRTTQKINSIKSQLEQLDNPDNIAALGGEAAADKQRQNLKLQLEPLKQFKAEMETALGSLRIDPVLAFTQSLRKLNLALAEGQEKSELRFNNERVAIASTQLKGFSTNKLATRNAALQNAVAERDKNQTNVGDLEKAVQATDTTVNASGFQTTLQRLGVSPDASVAKIDDVLKNTTDEADKGILEKLKSAREQKNKLSEARVGLSESQLKVKQTTQDNSLFSIDESAANSRAATTKKENQSITGIKKALGDKNLVEEVANEKISRIQLASTRSQQKSLDGQLSALRTYYDQGAISAEEFAKRERDLTVEQTNLEKQESENRLAVQSAVLARRLKEIEFFNKKAEALTATRATDNTRKAKEKLLTAGLTPQAQDQFALAQTKIDATTASDRVKSIQSRIAQNKQLYKEGSKDAREFMLEQYALNQELAQANLAVVDQKITAEEKYRETVEHNIQRIMALEENRFKKQTSELDESKSKLDLYNQSLERTNRLEQSRRNLSKALSDAAIAPLENKKADGDDALALVEKLKDPKLNPQVKAAIKAQLEKLGFAPRGGVTVTPATVTKSSSGDTPLDLELRIKEKQAQIENEIESRKQKALEMEQEFQRKTLENDLKRQKIAAQIALYEAQSAQLSAQKAKNEAEGALKIAIAKKDPVAIETAKTNLEIANRQIDLSNERISSAQANLNDQPEIAANAIQEQKATQGAETSSLQATINRSDRATALNLVESSAQAGKPINLSEAEAKARVNPELALPQRIDINQMPKLDLKPGESIFDAYQRQRDGMKLPTGAKADIPPVDKTSLAINSTSIQPRESAGGNQFMEALRMANQGIEQRLDNLKTAIITLANTPRSLTVQSPNPVDDAAKLMNDVSRGQLVGQGL